MSSIIERLTKALADWNAASDHRTIYKIQKQFSVQPFEIEEILSALATHPLATAVLQQEAGEPVAKPFGWYGESRFDNDFTTNEDMSRRWHANGYRLTPLYATPQVSPPQARVPLTDDAINELWMDGEWYRPGLIANGQAEAFARAIEAAHGITPAASRGERHE